MDELRSEIVWRIERVKGGWCTVADRVGCNRTALYRSFKMEGYQPTVATLLKVADVLGVKVILTPR